VGVDSLLLALFPSSVISLSPVIASPMQPNKNDSQLQNLKGTELQLEHELIFKLILDLFDILFLSWSHDLQSWMGRIPLVP